MLVLHSDLFFKSNSVCNVCFISPQQLSLVKLLLGQIIFSTPRENKIGLTLAAKLSLICFNLSSTNATTLYSFANAIK
jgi:hypothetical protein